MNLNNLSAARSLLLIASTSMTAQAILPISALFSKKQLVSQLFLGFATLVSCASGLLAGRASYRVFSQTASPFTAKASAFAIGYLLVHLNVFAILGVKKVIEESARGPELFPACSQSRY